MINDAKLQAEVQNAIKWEPLLRNAEIGVTVRGGVVSLTGIVDSYVKKMNAEDAVKKVVGVKALVENIKVKFPSTGTKTDGELAKEVLTALKSIYSVPNDKVAVKVEEGWVTLTGEVPWNYQKEAAKNVVSHLTGVKGVTNNIKIKEKTHDAIEKKEIEEAIARSWSLDDCNINVSVSGTTVTLNGTVNSWYQREEAGRIAWKSVGIQYLKNKLVVEHSFNLAY